MEKAASRHLEYLHRDPTTQHGGTLQRPGTGMNTRPGRVKATLPLQDLLGNCKKESLQEGWRRLTRKAPTWGQSTTRTSPELLRQPMMRLGNALEKAGAALIGRSVDTHIHQLSKALEKAKERKEQRPSPDTMSSSSSHKDWERPTSRPQSRTGRRSLEKLKEKDEAEVIASPAMPAGVTANYIAMAHAIGSSTHAKDYCLWMVDDQGVETSANRARDVPLPAYQVEIDFQQTPSLAQAHVIAQRLNDAVLLYYRDVSSHSWRNTTYFSSGVSDKNARRGKVQLRRTLVRSENRPPRVDFTFGLQGRFLARDSCAWQPSRASDRQPGQK